MTATSKPPASPCCFDAGRGGGSVGRKFGPGWVRSWGLVGVAFACCHSGCRSTLNSMLRLRLAFWSLMAALLVVAAGLGIVKFNATRAQTQAVRVPPGDQEIAWFHTATNTA